MTNSEELESPEEDEFAGGVFTYGDKLAYGTPQAKATELARQATEQKEKKDREDSFLERREAVRDDLGGKYVEQVGANLVAQAGTAPTPKHDPSTKDLRSTSEVSREKAAIARERARASAPDHEAFDE